MHHQAKSLCINLCIIVGAFFALTLAQPFNNAVATSITIPGSSETINIGGQFGFDSPGDAIDDVIQLILAGSAVVAFIFILWGAFKYVTAGDDSAKTQAARSTITNAVVGLILVALSYVIWLIVVDITQLDVATNSSPPTPYEQCLLDNAMDPSSCTHLQ